MAELYNSLNHFYNEKENGHFLAQTNRMLRGHTLFESLNMVCSVVDFFAFAAKWFLSSEEISPIDIT